uniref:Uncharacterized protein n=1 Tax=Romanomermis culicivorax TaxID=13658 RepID=A0A915IUQ4_ROMCU
MDNEPVCSHLHQFQLRFRICAIANCTNFQDENNARLPSLGQGALDIVTKVVNVNSIKIWRKMKSGVDRQIWIAAKKREEW